MEIQKVRRDRDNLTFLTSQTGTQARTLFRSYHQSSRQEMGHGPGEAVHVYNCITVRLPQDHSQNILLYVTTV